MRATLRRSCDACAKAKHGCDLGTPRCSRCIKRKVPCVYANQPLTSPAKAYTPSPEPSEITGLAGNNEVSSLPATHEITPDRSVTLVNPATASFDPFDSYPPTRLHRVDVQRLIHHFLSNIAFQYYPLDLNMESNPFVVSWWPLALADPALFHVSLQTASLDEESRARKGFPISELLMVDSVSLVRQKIEDPALAYEDETLDSVVTLAAIEHGKGNVEASRMHIEGVKHMVNARGGIGQIKHSSSLTARMVSWVSMLLMESPQFPAEDDSGFGSGLGPSLQWQLASAGLDSQSRIFDDLDIDPAIINILTRLRNILHEPWVSRVTNTALHDLTCYAVHRLLLLPLSSALDTIQAAVSECLRYAMVLYMLIIHGTTYYSHVLFANTILFKLKPHLDVLTQSNYVRSLQIWVLSIGMASAISVTDYPWLMDQAAAATIAFGLHGWGDVRAHLERVLWMRTEQGEDLFRQKWEEIFRTAATPANMHNKMRVGV